MKCFFLMVTLCMSVSATSQVKIMTDELNALIDDSLRAKRIDVEFPAEPLVLVDGVIVTPANSKDFASLRKESISRVTAFSKNKGYGKVLWGNEGASGFILVATNVASAEKQISNPEILYVTPDNIVSLAEALTISHLEPGDHVRIKVCGAKNKFTVNGKNYDAIGFCE